MAKLGGLFLDHFLVSVEHKKRNHITAVLSDYIFENFYWQSH